MSTTRVITYKQKPVDVIIDVRSHMEWLFGHIESARCIPVERLESQIGKLEGITTESRILLYCQNGSRSKLACAILRRMGYHHVIDGGPLARMKIEAKRGGGLRFDER